MSKNRRSQLDVGVEFVEKTASTEYDTKKRDKFKCVSNVEKWKIFHLTRNSTALSSDWFMISWISCATRFPWLKFDIVFIKSLKIIAEYRISYIICQWAPNVYGSEREKVQMHTPLYMNNSQSNVVFAGCSKCTIKSKNCVDRPKKG